MPSHSGNEQIKTAEHLHVLIDGNTKQGHQAAATPSRATSSTKQGQAVNDINTTEQGNTKQGHQAAATPSRATSSTKQGQAMNDINTTEQGDNDEAKMEDEDCILFIKVADQAETEERKKRPLAEKVTKEGEGRRGPKRGADALMDGLHPGEVKGKRTARSNGKTSKSD